jgi:hypothetical protein
MEVSVDSAWGSAARPGVFEEIFLSLEAGKPVYLCGAFGGTAAASLRP